MYLRFSASQAGTLPLINNPSPASVFHFETRSCQVTQASFELLCSPDRPWPCSLPALVAEGYRYMRLVLPRRLWLWDPYLIGARSLPMGFTKRIRQAHRAAKQTVPQGAKCSWHRVSSLGKSRNFCWKLAWSGGGDVPMPELGCWALMLPSPLLCLSLSLSSVLGFSPDSRCVFSHDQRNAGFLFDTASPDSGHQAPTQDLLLSAT